MDIREQTREGPILVVEDNNEDYETTVRALKQVGVERDIRRCEDGEEALEYLYHRGQYADPQPHPRPAIVLLDLNMPGTDGFEVLDTIKRDRDLKAIPVIVLTTSSSEQDIQVCYTNGANSYIQKPVDLNGFVATVKRLNEYWFETVVLA